MNVKPRKLEVDAKTAEVIEARAAARGLSVSQFLAELMSAEDFFAADLESMRAAGQGPWSPAAMAEDARHIADFERSREGVPWEEVKAWMESWGTPQELPPPKPRKL